MNLFRNGITAPSWLFDCCSQDPLSPYYQPFSDRDFTYATNQRVLVRVARIAEVRETSDAQLHMKVTAIMEAVDKRLNLPWDTDRNGWVMPEALPFDGTAMVSLHGSQFSAHFLKSICALPISAVNVLWGMENTPLLVAAGIGVRAALKPMILRPSSPSLIPPPPPTPVTWKQVTAP